jgi:hypothetical protein
MVAAGLPRQLHNNHTAAAANAALRPAPLAGNTLKRFLMGPSDAPSTLGAPNAELPCPLGSGGSDASRWNAGTAARFGFPRALPGGGSRGG